MNLTSALADLEHVAQSRAGMGFKLFNPYPLQAEFVRLTAESDNLCLSGANRTGKTSLVGRYLLPVWLTGDYHEDWQGRRWNRAITAWVGSTDWTTNVDGCQRALLGDVHKDKSLAGRAYWDADLGQYIAPGIPAASIDRIEMNPHVKGAVSRVFVKNKFGGSSEVRFISYLQGRERLQAGKIDVAWPDEEPPEDVNTELSARTIDSAGISLLTFTPLKGISAVVKAFIGDAVIDANMPKVLRGSSGIMVRMSAHDVPHLGPEKIAAMQRRYPKHEWPARIEGIPALGEGAIYPFDDEFLTIPAFEIPPHWKVFDALDFGFTHPTARARVVMNPDTKEVFLTQTYKAAGKSPTMHQMEWEKLFKWRVPVGWPHDGRNSETDGRTKIAKYREIGLFATPGMVRMPGQKKGMIPLEGSLQMMYDLMQEGKFKVFAGQHHFFAEKALYRREKKRNALVAEVVKVNDDLMDAVRYAVCGILAGMGVMVDTAKRDKQKMDVYQGWVDGSGQGGISDFDPFGV